MAVLPLPANRCKGTFADGTPNLKFFCKKTSEVNSCVTMRYFKVSCPKINMMCNSLSGAYVAAATCCAQKLF